jgi:hypothetical protein
VLRVLGIGVIAVVVALLATVFLARFGDGPTAIIPGGPLVSSALYSGPEPDWTFARDLSELEFQLEEQDSSRTLWLLVVDEKLYVVSGYMNSTIGKLWKHWPMAAEKDGRAMIRLDGKRYERRLVRTFDEATVAALAAEANRKYGAAMSADAATTGDVWFFEVLPRTTS